MASSRTPRRKTRRALRPVAASPAAEALARVAAAAATLAPDATVQIWRASSDGRLSPAAAVRSGNASARRPRPAAPRALEAIAAAVVASPGPVVGRRGLTAFAGLRLTRGGRLLGVLAVTTRRRRRFGDQAVALLRVCGAQAATILEGSGAADGDSHRLRRLQALSEIGREIAQERDSEALLALISRRATELLHGDSATVFLVEPADGSLRPAASFGADDWVRDVVVAPGQGLCGAALLDRKGVIANDYPSSPWAIMPFRERDWAVIAQPLQHGEALYGVILVRRREVGHGFTDDDLAALGDLAVQAAIALASARRLELASARAERVAAAAAIGQLLAKTRDPDRILDLIADKVRDVLGARAFGLFRPLPSGRLAYVRGFGLDDSFMAAHSLAPGEGVVGRAAAERRTIETADLLRDPAITLSALARARIEGVGSRAILAAPMLTPDAVLGVLAVYYPVGFRVPADQVEFLELLASHGATALDSARLLAETERRQASAETLAAVSQSLASSLDQGTVITLVVEAVCRLLGCDGGALGLVRPDGVVEIAGRLGLGAEQLRQARIEPGAGLTGWVVTHGQPFWTNDYGHDPRIKPVYADELREAGIVTMLGVPVRLRDETVGVLFGFHGRAVQIAEQDVALASDLARMVAIAVANARLYQEASRREAEARALFEVGRLIGGTLDAERVLDLIVEKALELMRVRACGLFRLEADATLRYARGAGLSRRLVEGLTVVLGEGAGGRAIVERTPVWTRDVLADPGLRLSPATRELVEQEGYHGVLAVPILVQGTPFGCLVAYWWEPHEPTPGEIETLASLAALAAVALENARLYGETRRHAERLERLGQINRVVSASLEVDDVLTQIAEAAGSFFEAPLAVVWIADEGQCALVRRASHGEPALLRAMPRRLAYGEAAAGWIAERREALIDLDIATDPRVAGRDLALALGVRSFTGFPLLLGDRLLGVLALGRRGEAALTETDLALLRALLGQAVIAIENARLFEAATSAYHELETAQDQLVQTEKLRALGEMASGVAHDFNNLLAAILGRVQLILRQITDPTLARWLQVIEQAALDGAQTVRQIQEFTRVRRDQPTELVDPNRAVEDALEMTRPRWHGASPAEGVQVRVETRLGPVPRVEGHPAELREVLTNLILNALDALPEGGTLSLVTRAVGDQVEIVIADSGVGMPEAVRRRIFEPFFTTKGPRGTGLGLAMAYGIVTRHGGQITVESEEGRGTEFTIRLPAARRGPIAPVPGVTLPPGRTARILVIDDEPEVRDTLADILEAEGHQVVAASSGAEGLARLGEAGFDLLMTDLAMPAMSGWQVAEAVQARVPGLPVVLVTGWGVEVPADQLRKGGVARVLTKPFRLDGVRELLAALLQGAS
jgi:GAF domain-containing protein/anti-sigma regulatory factor (Ser/Thr protein kinase)